MIRFAILFLIIVSVNAYTQINPDLSDNALYRQNNINNLLLLDTKCESIKKYIEEYFVLTDSLGYKTIPKMNRKNIKDAWAQFIDIYLTLDDLHRQFENKMDEYPQKQVLEILMFYSYAMSYDLGLHIIEKTININHYEVLLDEAQPEYGINSGQYTNLKFQIIHSNFLSSLTNNYKNTLAKIEKAKEIDNNFITIKEKLEEKYEYIQKMRNKFGKIYFLKNTADFFTDLQHTNLMPIQKKSLKIIGDTRLTMRHGGLISKQQCDSLKQILEPGDLLFERKEWYLSNIGLPGFWPHSALYIGNSQQLKEWSEDDELFDFYQNKYPDFVDFPSYLEKKYQTVWRKYLEKDETGEPLCIMEAIGEGVLFHTIYQSIGASDYFAALRPKLSKKDIAQAIELAFQYYGRNYDFDFDFLSDNELVCSELVFKCYENEEDKNGLNFNLEYIMGRLTLPPNSMIAQFCKDTANSKLSFVTFYDANEEEGYTTSASYDFFKYSFLRPRWGYSAKNFMEDLMEGDIDSIYTVQTKTKYLKMPLNMSFFLGQSFGNSISDGKEIINYVSINFLSGRAARLRGIEVGVLWNYYSEYMTGVQIAVVMNTVIEDSYGFQIAGISNLTASDFYGVQASGLANLAGNSMVGFQLSLLSNSCEKLYGVQIAPLVNTSLDKSLGVQLGLINIAMILKNTQLGIFNTAGDMSGFQFGFANGALNVKKGVQLGLINISKENKGLPIGLFSYVNDKLPEYQIWFDEIPSINFGVKSGSENIYNQLYFGKFLNSSQNYSIGWGLGTNIKFKKLENFSFDIGSNIRHIFHTNKNYFTLNEIIQLEVGFNYRILDKLNFSITPTYNFFISEIDNMNYLNFPTLTSAQKDNKYMKSWIGIGFGLSY